MLRRTLLLTAVAWLGVCQEQAPPAAQGQYEFLSGTVSELPPGKIVVNRAILGKPPEHHTFLVTSETKIEGELKVNARVTVGYRAADGGEAVAVRIIVRPPQRPNK